MVGDDDLSEPSCRRNLQATYYKEPRQELLHPSYHRGNLVETADLLGLRIERESGRIETLRSVLRMKESVRSPLEIRMEVDGY